MHAMMKDSGCPMALWGEAVSTTAYCLNRTATSSNGGITPIQAFKGTTPDISHMRVFYSDAYIHQPKTSRAKKLGDHACLVKFMGYLEGVSGYKFYDPQSHAILLSHSPHFLESMQHQHNQTQDHHLVDELTDDNVSITSDSDDTHDHCSPPLPSSSPSPPSSCTPSPPLTHELPRRQLCDWTHIRAPMCLDPADFGAHG